MSYVIHVWQSPVPRSDDDVWRIISELVAEQDGNRGTTPPALHEFVARITGCYPDLMDLPDDEEGVWTDGPIEPCGPIEVIGIRAPCVDEIQPFVVAEANRLGLVCYDMQLGRLYLPTQSQSERS